jgi:sensor domain CHASE-containing protein
MLVSFVGLSVRFAQEGKYKNRMNSISKRLSEAQTQLVDLNAKCEWLKGMTEKWETSLNLINNIYHELTEWDILLGSQYKEEIFATLKIEHETLENNPIDLVKTF